MKLKRTITAVIAVVLCLCTFLSLGPGAEAKTGDEVRAAKKVISVVYDDSGSMAGEKWINANYAMQALVAQLNSHDELYISYMKSPKDSDRIGLDNVEQAVKTIRNIPGGGTTPFQTVETAFNKLKSHKEKDFTTQYWLVVLTDGEFEKGEKIDNALNSYVGTQMSNESALHVVYVGIGNAPDVTPDPAKGLYSYHAGTAKEIVGVMRDMANLVSGRIRVDDLEKIDDSTVRFSSKLPLYSFSVLSQNSAASVVKAESDEAELDISRNLGLDASDVSRTITRHLLGNAAVIVLKANAKKSTVIPAGTYTIHFSEPVEFENITVQYEPAIDMKAVLKKDGSAVTDTSQLGESDTVDIVVTPVVPGTDQVIPDADLPRDIKWTVEYENNGKTIASSKSRELKNVSLQLGSAILRGTMEIPGFVPISYEIYLDIDKPNIELGLTVDQPDDVSYYRSKPSKGSLSGQEVTFRITGNGKLLTAEEIKDMKLSLVTGNKECDNSNVTGFFNRFGQTMVDCRIKRNSDGSFTLRPTDRLLFTAFARMAGDYTVTVSVNKDDSVTARGQFTVIPRWVDWLELIGFILSVLFVIHFLYAVFGKKRFQAGTLIEYQSYTLNRDGTGEEGSYDSLRLGPLSGHPVLTFGKACKVKYCDLELVAGEGGSVYATPESIADAAYSYVATTKDPKNSLDAIIDSMKLTKKPGDSGISVTEQPITGKPIYFRSSADTETVWCLKKSESR